LPTVHERNACWSDRAHARLMLGVGGVPLHRLAHVGPPRVLRLERHRGAVGSDSPAQISSRPAPLRPQSRSGGSSALARSTRPSAITTSTEIRLSHVMPHLRSSQPKSLPSVRPGDARVDTRRPVTARPWACVAASSRRSSVHSANGDHEIVRGGKCEGDPDVVGARTARDHRRALCRGRRCRGCGRCRIPVARDRSARRRRLS
jgi:hypothetical protein